MVFSHLNFIKFRLKLLFLGLVFPARFDKKPGGGRATVKPAKGPAGPPPLEITVRKGVPTRASTEFTGWPSAPTTPFSIEKYLEMQKSQGAVEISINELLSGTSVATTSSTTSKFCNLNEFFNN